jgi:uncharacterized membrane protein YdjX (TVP38/TMEM64 family)
MEAHLPPARSRGDKADEEGEEEEDAAGRAGKCASAFCCVLIFAVVGLSIVLYGPSEALRYMLNLLPERPGWGWFVGLGLATSVSIVMLMPIWPPLCMTAGLVFGLRWGAVLNFVSITSAAVVSICLGRWVLQEPIRHMLEQGDYPRVRRMMLVLEDRDSSLKFQVLFRFLFIPMFLRNYGPAALQVPLWKLCAGTLPHSAWISFLFASLGATFKDAAELIKNGHEVSFEDMRWQQGVLLLVSVAVMIALSWYAMRKYNEALDCGEAQGLQEPKPAKVTEAAA